MCPIKIIKKNAVSSNKDQTPPEMPEMVNEVSIPTVPSLEPFIDKIMIDITPPSEKSRKELHNAFFTYAGDKSHFLDAKPNRGFSIGKRIVLGESFDTKSNPYLSVAHGQDQITKLRLEFSPQNLGVYGMNQLHSVLSLFTDSGWAFVVEHGRARKIEVSVDIPNVKVGDLLVLPSQTTVARTWKKGGMIETLVIGQSASGKQTRIYDRGAKRQAKGQFDPKYNGTRIEVITRLARDLTDLGKMPNPFKHIRLLVAPPPPNDPKPYIWTMFMDSVAARTLPVALKLLPEEKRTEYRKWLKQYPVDWWNPDAIWAKWPKYLEESWLLPPN